jgi:hypothetical protein
VGAASLPEEESDGAVVELKAKLEDLLGMELPDLDRAMDDLKRDFQLQTEELLAGLDHLEQEVKQYLDAWLFNDKVDDLLASFKFFHVSPGEQGNGCGLPVRKGARGERGTSVVRFCRVGAAA